jgi:hypothetical protein
MSAWATVTFGEVGVGSDFSGTVLNVDGNSTGNNVSAFPINFNWDVGSNHTFAYRSRCTNSANTTRYVWTSTTGLSTSQNGTIIVPSGGGSVTANYKTQYYLTVVSVYDTPGGTGWYDSGATVSATLANGTVIITPGLVQAVFTGWSGDATGTGLTSNLITMNGPKTAIANWNIQYYLAVVTNPSSLPTIPGAAWYNNWTIVALTAPQYVPNATGVGGVRYNFRYWDVDGASQGVGVNPISILMNASHVATAHFTLQYLVTFEQTGLDGTANGTVVTVDGSAKAYGDLPFSEWVNNGTIVNYSYSSTVSSSVSGVQFELNSITGQASPLNVTGPFTVVGNYETLYNIVFNQTGIGSDFSGEWLFVDNHYAYYNPNLPVSFWWYNGSSHSFSFASILALGLSEHYIWISTTGLSNLQQGTLNVTTSGSLTGNYQAQYQLTFDQSGVGSDFNGTVVTIDGTSYTVNSLPASFWWDNDSSHSFSFASPLVVNETKQYSWESTSGLSNAQNGTLTITTGGSVVGAYELQNAVLFDETGVGSDFAGTVLVVDGTPYGLTELPVPFYWQLGTMHNFTFQSPLTSITNGTQYVWTSTTGLSSLQSASITVTSYGTIVGNYKTQYYLTLATAPSGADNLTGAGWYDIGTYAAISANQYVTIPPNPYQYIFNGWTTVDMTELNDSSATSTIVLMDKGKTVTANYLPEQQPIISAPLVQSQMFNKTINVNINITDLNADDAAVQFQFRLCYNSTLLQPLGGTLGHFWFSGPWGTLIPTPLLSVSIQDDPVYGPSVLVYITLPKDPLTHQWDWFPNGNGTMAILSFNTTDQMSYRPWETLDLQNNTLNCSLSIVQDQIINSNGGNVPHSTQNGMFEMLPENICDLNHDYKVDIRDVHIAAVAYGSYGPNYTSPGSPPSSNWNPIADVTGPNGVPDNKVDIRDVHAVATQYGWKALDP